MGICNVDSNIYFECSVLHVLAGHQTIKYRSNVLVCPNKF